MRKREAAVDLRFSGILRRKEIVESLFAADHARVRIGKLFGAVVKVLLDRPENFRCARDEFFHQH